MSEFLHIRKPGTACAPKVEMVSNNAGLTNNRIYLIPIVVKGQEIFSEYDVDMLCSGGNAEVVCAIYEQVDRIGSSGVTAQLVAGSGSVPLIIATGATFRIIPLGANLTLLPGSYWIAFQFNNLGGATISSNNSTRVGTWFTGRWVHRDPGSYTMPATINGTDLVYTATGEYPVWAAIRYTGDTF